MFLSVTNELFATFEGTTDIDPNDKEINREIKTLKSFIKIKGPQGIKSANAVEKFRKAEEFVNRYGRIADQLNNSMVSLLQKSYTTINDRRLKDYVDTQNSYRKRLMEIYEVKQKLGISSQGPGSEMRLNSRDSSRQSGRQSSREYQSPGRISRREEFESRGLHLGDRGVMSLDDSERLLEKRSHFDDRSRKGDFERDVREENMREDCSSFSSRGNRRRASDNIHFNHDNQPQHVESGRKRPFLSEDMSMPEKFGSQNQRQGGPAHFDDLRYLREDIVDSNRRLDDMRDSQRRSLRDELPKGNQTSREAKRNRPSQNSPIRPNRGLPELEQRADKKWNCGEEAVRSINEESVRRAQDTTNRLWVHPRLEQTMEPNRNQDSDDLFVGKNWEEKRSRPTRPWEFAGMDQESRETHTWKENFGRQAEDKTHATHPRDLLRMKERSAREPNHGVWVGKFVDNNQSCAAGSGSPAEDFSRRINRPRRTTIPGNQLYREDSHSQTNYFNEFKPRRQPNLFAQSNFSRY